MKIKKIFFALIIIILVLIFIIDLEKSKKNEFIIEENGRLEVFFCPQNNCSDIITSLIYGSESVFCAFYEIKNENLIKSITENGNAVVFEENYENFGYPVKSLGLMHNKFCVINKSIVVTGSHNPTNSKNQDNIIIIGSKTLADNYFDEYYELIDKENHKTRITEIIFNNYTLNNYFCPEDDCQKRILEEIMKANKSINILLFTFTDDDIADELIRKQRNGINVTLIYEPFQGQQYAVMPKLAENNIKVLKYNGEAIQHNKIFIIDESVVITGSYNPTKAAYTKNDENIIIIRQPDIVRKYNERFLFLLNFAVTFTNFS